MNYNFNQKPLRISYSLYIVITKYKVCLFAGGKHSFVWKLKRHMIWIWIFSHFLRVQEFVQIFIAYLFMIYLS